jgi:hypothetical protein
MCLVPRSKVSEGSTNLGAELQAANFNLGKSLIQAQSHPGGHTKDG